MIEKIRHWLWKRGYYHKCPNCKSDLMEHGFGSSAIYTCSNKNCNFGK